MSPVLILIVLVGTAAAAVHFRREDQRRAREATRRMRFTVNGVMYATCVFVSGFLTAALLVNLFYNRF